GSAPYTVSRTPGSTLLFSTAHSPSHTLFPYTTLFRSVGVSSSVVAGPRLALAVGLDQESAEIGDRAVDLGRLGRPPGAHPRIERDRKSTRLNSSHVKISYAVFCLKEKKIGTNE